MSKQLESELISRAADDLGIGKSLDNINNDWKSRTIYSMSGRIGLCSLWDKLEDDDVSIIHFRKAIERELAYLLKIYTECKSLFPDDLSILSDEFLNIYLKCGYIYHSPFKIHPAIYKSATVGNIEFLRGVFSEFPCKMSGLGLYRISKTKNTNHENVSSVLKLFQIHDISILDYGNSIISNAIWNEFSFSGRIEYLKSKGSFRSGYWWQEPEKDGNVSILRAGERGQQIYYLYYYKGNKCYSSMLQPWQVENGEYRKIALYIISKDHEEPNIEYHESGSVVRIKQNYLLPPDELNLIKLYSWPLLMKNGIDDFNRIMNKEVFKSIKIILESIGYTFKGV